MRRTLIDNVFEETLKYLACMPKTKRKIIGQFFTSVETARYMASMFSAPKKDTLTIVDPGSGSGILAAAAVDRLQNDPIVKHIHITCYETSKDVLPILKSNLSYIKANSATPLKYSIVEENYITSQSDDFNGTMMANSTPAKYDWVICNPPYKKLSKNAAEAICMPEICYGTPNLYSLFMAMGLFNLDSQGEMVFIVPRSWTSGAYFGKFRKFLLDAGTLKHIHLFSSRDRVFEKESVLQETIIVKIGNSKERDTIKITCSNTSSDFKNISVNTVPYSIIVSGPEKYVYLVTTDTELKTLHSLKKWDNTLPSIGLKMRTGLTVDFRSTGYLRENPEDGTVPLLYAQHIKNGRTVFPVQREHEYITTENPSLTQKNKNYLLVKRFTAKEEKRRLQSGIYLSSDLPQYRQISTENKVNFVEGIDFDMTDEQVYGLYVIFNSTVYDRYYRILNGSTQVNSTEINAMPVPPLAEIEKLGTMLMDANDLSVNTCDNLLGGLFMNKIDEARDILISLGMPPKQYTDLCCYSLLAMLGITPDIPWSNATNQWIRIHDIMRFTSRNYHAEYAENSRETFRKQAMHHFRNAALIEDNAKATNSPNYRYRITQESLELIQSYGTSNWPAKLMQFKADHNSLIDLYASKKQVTKMPVRINGADFTFSPGKHNELQKSIIEDFAPRFAQNSQCLYVGDTIQKDLVKNTGKLADLGFTITLHDKMPDVVLYREDVDWLYFIESVTSVGPMSPKRILEIEAMTRNVASGKIYVTAFPDTKTFKRFAEELAWDTEVWISDMPEHMIHLNGDRFMGPRK